MANSLQDKAVMFSDKTYQRLLALYPAEHRREYGPAMAQLFRDQCRDAWRERRWSGLARLWLRVLPDLFKTSLLEHLTARNERKSMFNKFYLAIVQRSTPTRVFVKVFLAVTLLFVLVSAVLTLLMPRSYCSTARIIPAQRSFQAGDDPYFLIQTLVEMIPSEVVLSRVIQKMDLNAVWGKRYAGGRSFNTVESLALLRSTLELRPVRNTNLIEIRAYSDKPEEAAAIANAIAKAYQDFSREQVNQRYLRGIKALEDSGDELSRNIANSREQIEHLRKKSNVTNPEPPIEALRAKYPEYQEAQEKLNELLSYQSALMQKIASLKAAVAIPQMEMDVVQIVDHAVPSLRPARPNIPLNLVLGTVLGMVSGLVLGAGAAGITLKARKNYLANLKSQSATA